MIKELMPLISLTTFLGGLYTLTQVLKLRGRKDINIKKKYKNYEKSDIFGLIRGYLGIVCIWMIFLIWGFK